MGYISSYSTWISLPDGWRDTPWSELIQPCRTLLWQASSDGISGTHVYGGAWLSLWPLLVRRQFLLLPSGKRFLGKTPGAGFWLREPAPVVLSLALGCTIVRHEHYTYFSRQQYFEIRLKFGIVQTLLQSDADRLLVQSVILFSHVPCAGEAKRWGSHEKRDLPHPFPPYGERDTGRVAHKGGLSQAKIAFISFYFSIFANKLQRRDAEYRKIKPIGRIMKYYSKTQVLILFSLTILSALLTIGCREH